MHREAEYGIASHIMYKDAQLSKSGVYGSSGESWFSSLVPDLFRPFIWRTSSEKSNKNLFSKEHDHKKKIPQWIQEIAYAHKTSGESREFFEKLKDDFFSHRIFVFTPEGDVVDLPVGASPIDFAYAIHSDIGDHVSGAKLNKKLVSLDTKLHNGDIVEITTKKKNKPTQKWLEYAKTSLARRKIRSSISKNMAKGKNS